MSEGASVLGRIVADTRERVHTRKRAQPIERMLALSRTPEGRRHFARRLARGGGINVIAEFKKRSPSRGLIRDDLHPVAVAQSYEIAGAAALSILTNETFFGGSLGDLSEARAATFLPTLQKDFIVDPYQVREAWIAGADAVLLIAAVLSDAELMQLKEAAYELLLDPLVEVHDREELERALSCGATLIGVNNRDLRTMEVRLETALELAPLIPDDVVAVAESGIRTSADLRRLRDAGYDGFLIGEHLMAAPQPGAALEALLGGAKLERSAP
jgi:indole-3-glycerol phosphate synthase